MGVVFINYYEGLEDVLAFVHQAGFSACEAWSAQAFKDLLTLPFYRLCIYEGYSEQDKGKENAELQGFLLYSCLEDEAEIITFVVLPSVQQKGIGRQILENLLSKLKEETIKSVFLEVAKENKRAISLYNRSGFKIQGERMNYYGQGKNALLMSRKFF